MKKELPRDKFVRKPEKVEDYATLYSAAYAFADEMGLGHFEYTDINEFDDGHVYVICHPRPIRGQRRRRPGIWFDVVRSDDAVDHAAYRRTYLGVEYLMKEVAPRH